MAQVLMFPEKKKLPKHIEEAVRKNAKEYAELLCATIALLDKDGLGQMEVEEIIALVSEAYSEGLSEAIDEMEES